MISIVKLFSTETLQNTRHFSTGINLFFFFKWAKDIFLLPKNDGLYSF